MSIFAKLPRGLWYSIAVVVLVPTALIGYQNCSDISQLPGQNGQSSLNSIPFAFDASLDQISYMSCSGLNAGSYDTNAFYSYRGGAFRTQGLAQSTDFINYSRNMNPLEKKNSIAISPLMKASRMQLSIRGTSDVTTIFNSGTPQENVDYQFMLDRLDSSYLLDDLFKVTAGSFVNFFPGGTNLLTQSMAGSLNFLSSEDLTTNSRTQLNTNAAILAVNFNNDPLSAINPTSLSDLSPGAPISEKQKIYGRGYSLHFNQPAPLASTTFSYLNNPNRALGAITEIDLNSKKNIISTWTCPTTAQFIIFKPGDAGCNKLVDPAVLSDTQKIVRNQLHPEDWAVDWTNRCVIPLKQGMCYGSTTGSAQAIQYLLDQPCGAGQTKACAHIVSVCYRN